MRVLIISDIHGNSVALEAVLADAGPHDAVWCLGDLVGYGPNPKECVERVRALPNLTCLVGNHDQAVLGLIPIYTFNLEARISIEWTQQQLAGEHLDYLQALPETQHFGNFTLVHGSPRQPVWEYILDTQIAQENFPYFNTPYCLVGHTHMPTIYQQLPPHGHVREETPRYRQPRSLNSHRLILNPGSVGQPRDSNPEAAYALLDVDSGVWEPRRVPYDIERTQARMRVAHLPERLVMRLAYGW